MKLDIGPPAPPPLSVVDNSATFRMPEVAPGCHQVATSQKASDFAPLLCDPTGNRTRNVSRTATDRTC